MRVPREGGKRSLRPESPADEDDDSSRQAAEHRLGDPPPRLTSSPVAIPALRLRSFPERKRKRMGHHPDHGRRCFSVAAAPPLLPRTAHKAAGADHGGGKTLLTGEGKRSCADSKAFPLYPVHITYFDQVLSLSLHPVRRQGSLTVFKPVCQASMRRGDFRAFTKQGGEANPGKCEELRRLLLEESGAMYSPAHLLLGPGGSSREKKEKKKRKRKV